jgi:hypothetical protein
MIDATGIRGADDSTATLVHDDVAAQAVDALSNLDDLILPSDTL